MSDFHGKPPIKPNHFFFLGLFGIVSGSYAIVMDSSDIDIVASGNTLRFFSIVAIFSAYMGATFLAFSQVNLPRALDDICEMEEQILANCKRLQKVDRGNPESYLSEFNTLMADNAEIKKRRANALKYSDYARTYSLYGLAFMGLSTLCFVVAEIL